MRVDRTLIGSATKERKWLIPVVTLAVVYFVVGILALSLWHSTDSDFSKQLQIARMLSVAPFVPALAALSIWWRQVLAFLRSFILADTAPVNLAIARIVVFSILFLYIDVDNLACCTNLLTDLRSIPHLSWLNYWLPINTTAVLIAAIVCRLACVAGVLGFSTRFFSLLALFTCMYAVSVNQCFGVTNHKCDSLIWFVAILAASPCADVLSLDALRSTSGRRIVRRGHIAPSWRYGLPIRTMWLLFGIIYFFPGFWKFWRFGFDWALGENFRHILSFCSITADPGLPIFNVEPFPLLYKLSGLAVIGFELSFVFLVLFRQARVFAVIFGFLFHCATFVFMGISFWTLQACYLIFLDWSALLKKLSNCQIVEDICKTYATPIESFGDAIVGRAGLPMMPIVCASLILVNTLLGALGKENCFPFACYPSFAFPFKTEYKSIRLEALDRDGRMIPLDLDHEMMFLFHHRLSVMDKIQAIGDVDLRHRALLTLWHSCLRTVSRLKRTELNRAVDLKFYRETISVMPQPETWSLSIQPLWQVSLRNGDLNSGVE